jgi:hypothetical protein
VRTRPIVLLQKGKIQNLSYAQRRFVEEIARRIEKIGLVLAPELNTTADLNQRFERLRQSQGTLTFAFALWNGTRVTRESSNPNVFPSEFVHVNVALAMAARRPVLLLKEKVSPSAGSFVGVTFESRSICRSRSILGG